MTIYKTSSKLNTITVVILISSAPVIIFLIFDLSVCALDLALSSATPQIPCVYERVKTLIANIN